MSSPTSGERIDESPWYRRWFGKEYLALYPHRDEAEAQEAVELLIQGCGLSGGDAVLDLACGAGRHLRWMREGSLRAVGLDLSRPLLLTAREADPAVHLVQADMRALPFAPKRFTAVTSFFTSFGYFRSDQDDRRVLSEVRRVLRDGGHLLLDFLNAQRVRETLSPHDEGMVGGRPVVQERRLVDEGRAVEKTIRIGGIEGQEPDVFRERVRLYSAPELEALLTESRLTIRRWFGDYSGSPLTESGPRVIALAQAS